jgi:hypothetical protein
VCGEAVFATEASDGGGFRDERGGSQGATSGAGEQFGCVDCIVRRVGVKAVPQVGCRCVCCGGGRAMRTLAMPE